MDDVNFHILLPPGVESIDCGNVRIYWLTPKLQLAEQDFRSVLDAHELGYSLTLKARLRREEYLRSRWLMRTLTGWRQPLPREASGAPMWPDGFQGSLTHKAGYVGISLSTKYAGIGIDAEDPARMHAGLEPKILTPSESELLESLKLDSGEHLLYLTRIFSFKEALFKAHYPLGKRMFYFHDAEVMSIGAGKIRGRVLVDTTWTTPKGTEVLGAYGEWSEPMGNTPNQQHSRQFVLTSCTLSTHS